MGKADHLHRTPTLMARRPISGWFSHGRKNTRGSGSTRRRPHLESLEGRLLLSAGDLDHTFGTNGQTIVAFDHGRTNSDVNLASAIQEDGKIVSVGSATFGSPGDTDFAITRLLPDGSPDTGFGFSGDGKVTVNFDQGAGLDDGARAVAMQRDGKIVVAGWCQRNDGNYDFAVLRLNPDGSRDYTFGPERDGRSRISFDVGGDKKDVATALAIQPDGRIVVAGDVRSYGGVDDTDFGIARLDASGRLDASFGSAGKTIRAFDRGGKKVDHVVGVAIQSTDKIVIAGTIQMDAPGDTDFGVTRLNADGSPDYAFGSPASDPLRPGTVTVRFTSNDDNANAMTLQGDKIVIVGEIGISPSDYDFGVARLTADGRPDPTFGSGGKVSRGFDMPGLGRDFATAVAVREDKIVVAGAIEMDRAGNYDFGLLQLTDSGELDTTFGGNNSANTPGLTTLGLRIGGRPTEDTPRGLILQGDQLVLTGSVRPIGGSNIDFGMIRVEAIDPPPPPPPANGEGSGGGNPGGPGGDEEGDGGSGGGNQGGGGSGGGNQGGGGSGGGNQGGGGSGGGGSGNGNQGNGGSNGGNQGGGGSGGGSAIVNPPNPAPKPTPDPAPNPPKDQTPPMIVAGQRIYSGSGRKRKVVGFKLFFSEAIDPATAAMGNFTVAAIKAVKRGVVKTSPVGAITSFYDPFDYSVSILTAPKAKFPRGAQVTVGAGVRDTAGNAIRTAAFNVL